MSSSEACAPVPPRTSSSQIWAWPPVAVSWRSPSLPLISQSRFVPRETPPRLRRPTTIRVGADDPDTNPLHGLLLMGLVLLSEVGYTCNCKHSTGLMVAHANTSGLPNVAGLEAWDAFLRAHASLMRRLEVDLAQATGLALADFDVLAQLARAGGELRMTDLATRALVSRSGMTRRVARLVEEGLVQRANVDSDGRGVVVALTDLGLARLAETAPVHLRGISELFLTRLDDQELAVLKRVLDKVTIDTTFG